MSFGALHKGNEVSQLYTEPMLLPVQVRVNQGSTRASQGVSAFSHTWLIRMIKQARLYALFIMLFVFIWCIAPVLLIFLYLLSDCCTAHG